MKSNIVLIGFMGTGKTSAGEILAGKLGWRFVETDTLIEQMAGKSIPDIFAQDGEIVFREWEIAAVKQVASGEKQVVACGGGVVLNTINIDRLKENGVLVLLTASPSVILRRTATDLASRPKLAGNIDPSDHIKELLKFRKPYYVRAADITVNTSQRDPDAVADSIIQKLREYEGFDFPQ